MSQQAFVQPQRQVQGSTPTASGAMQRKCDKCSKKKKNPTLQRREVSSAPETMPFIPGEHSPTAAVDATTHAVMEPRFSHDFSQIPAHTRPQARIQAKLAVNAPGDIYEQEADRVADQVLATPGQAVRSAPLQIQRLAGSSGGQMEAPASVDRALASPGRPLEPALRRDMEQPFGYDFSRVRVHTGTAAEQSAREVNASAYTVGHDIVFGADKFKQRANEGRRLLAHELTHFVQQSGADAGRTRHNNDNFGGATISQPVMEGGDVARCMQRQPASSSEIEMSGEWAFAADKRKRTWRGYARSLGKKDAARIRKSGKLSSADREEVNAKLRFFEGDAMWSYIEEIKPALIEVTREEIEMPGESSGGSTSDEQKRVVPGPRDDEAEVEMRHSRRPAHPNAEVLKSAQGALKAGDVWRERKYGEAKLSLPDYKGNRDADLAYQRALRNLEIEMTPGQEAHQKFAPIFDDETEHRINARRSVLMYIANHKSLKEGVKAARAKAKDAVAREQVQIVETDMKTTQEQFRSKAYDNAYRLLDESSREVSKMLHSYGVMIAGASDIVHHVRTYEGDIEEQATKWLETARGADTSGFSDPRKAEHRKDLGATLRHLKQLQKAVHRERREHTPTDATSILFGPVFSPNHKDAPEVKRAKAELAGAWINAEREHPVLASYRAGEEKTLEDAPLGSKLGNETADMEGVIREAERLLANILTAKLALRQNKLSPFEIGAVVRLTKAQMLIRRGSAWDIAVEEMMRGDDEGESWAKAALQVALGALSLFPGAWVVALVSAGIDLYSAGTAYVQYGLDTALVGTSMDRAKALSDKTPSLAPFAFALLGAGLNAAGARAAFAEAEALSVKAVAGDAQAIADLNKLGETHHVAHLGDDVAKARPVGSQSRTGYSRTAPTSEEEIASAAGRTRRRVGPTDRGKGARPRYADDPVKPKVPGAPKTKVPTNVATDRIRQIGKWEEQGKIVGGDTKGLRDGLHKGSPEAEAEYLRIEGEIKRGNYVEVEPSTDIPAGGGDFELISTAGKQPLRNSPELKAHIPDQNLRNQFMAWLKENHVKGDLGDELPLAAPGKASKPVKESHAHLNLNLAELQPWVRRWWEEHHGKWPPPWMR